MAEDGGPVAHRGNSFSGRIQGLAQCPAPRTRCSSDRVAPLVRPKHSAARISCRDRAAWVPQPAPVCAAPCRGRTACPRSGRRGRRAVHCPHCRLGRRSLFQARAGSGRQLHRSRSRAVDNRREQGRVFRTCDVNRLLKRRSKAGHVIPRIVSSSSIEAAIKNSSSTINTEGKPPPLSAGAWACQPTGLTCPRRARPPPPSRSSLTSVLFA